MVGRVVEGVVVGRVVERVVVERVVERVVVGSGSDCGLGIVGV